MSDPSLLPHRLLDPRLLGARAHGRRPNQAQLPPIRLPRLTPCTHEPKLVIMDFDDSGSVTGANDPIGNRYEEAGVALDHLGRRCRCRQELVAVRHFDVGTTSDVGPLAADRRGRDPLRHALAAPTGAYGSSNLGPSLASAEKLAAVHPDHKVVLAVFSDFELCDASPAQMMDQFSHWRFGPVHAVVLRSEPPAQLEDTNVIVTAVRWDSPRGVVARAVLDALTLGRIG